MSRELLIDRAVYRLDDETRTYRYARSNPRWRLLSFEENEANKRALEGYARHLADGTNRVFHRAGHP